MQELAGTLLLIILLASPVIFIAIHFLYREPGSDGDSGAKYG